VTKAFGHLHARKTSYGVYQIGMWNYWVSGSTTGSTCLQFVLVNGCQWQSLQLSVAWWSISFANTCHAPSPSNQ